MKRSNSQSSLGLNSIDSIKMSTGVDQLNLTVLKKFRLTLTQLQSQSNKPKNFTTKNDEKFTDNIFPPIYSSLFTIQSNSNFKKRIGSDIVWKRIP
jgi:hypothetical protein